MPTENTKKIVTKIFSDAAIDAAIVDVSNSAKSLQQKIHNVAVSTLLVWFDAKGKKGASTTAVERLNALQNASPYHAKAFAAWVQVYLPMLSWSDENKVWYTATKRLQGKVFTEARDNPFWEVSPAPTPQPVDMLDKLQKILDANRKRRDSDKAHAEDTLLSTGQERLLADLLSK